jgi:hypothetical protein
LGGLCAAVVQPGYAGGNLTASSRASVVTDDGANAFRVAFSNANGTFYTSAFMLIVTCGA